MVMCGTPKEEAEHDKKLLKEYKKEKKREEILGNIYVCSVMLVIFIAVGIILFVGEKLT